jgi:hypothetical protein
MQISLFQFQRGGGLSRAVQKQHILGYGGAGLVFLPPPQMNDQFQSEIQ